MALEQFSNDAVTTLVNTISNTATSLTVASNLGFPTAPQFRIRIDNEIMLVTSVSGATWHITRAVEPVGGLTAAAAHAAGATVTHVLTQASLKSAGIQNNLAGLTIPTTSNDNTQGYSVGSLWYNSIFNTLYVCLNAAIGAALWWPVQPTGILSINIDSSGEIKLVNDANVSGIPNYYYGTSGTTPYHLGYWTLPYDLTIGNRVSGGTGNQLLCSDGSDNLAGIAGANPATGEVDFAGNGFTVALCGSSGSIASSDGNRYLTFCDGFAAAQFHAGVTAAYVWLCTASFGEYLTDGTNYVTLCDGTNAMLVNGPISFFGVMPVGQQAGTGTTAGGAYTSNEQNMINAIYGALQAYGLMT